MKRLTSSMAFALVTGVMAAGSLALGHSWEDSVNPTETANNNGERDCAAAAARVADGNYDKGSARGTVYSTVGSNCDFRKYKVAGNLKVKTQYWHRENNQWDPCWGDGWQDSNIQDWEYSRYHEWINNQPCGQGYYKVIAWGGVKVDGNWIGENVSVATDPAHNVDDG